jgi:hypothetical protein
MYTWATRTTRTTRETRVMVIGAIRRKKTK